MNTNANRFANIYAMFSCAISNNLKFPKIRLHSEKGTVIVKLAGDRSKYCGQIMVTNDAGFGSILNKYFGRIDQTGAIIAGRDLTPEVESLLEQFSADPLATALKYGKLTGNCMFCGKPLFDKTGTSQACGYGPTCAKKYNLPWKPIKASKQEASPVVAVEADDDVLAEVAWG